MGVYVQYLTWTSPAAVRGPHAIHSSLTVPWVAAVACDALGETRSWSHPTAIPVVSLWELMRFNPGFSLPLFHKMTTVWTKRKALFSVITELERAGSTSMQTLSSSICGFNREISRKALKVITLDKKGICSWSTAAGGDTFSYFWGTLDTEVQWNLWSTVQYKLWCHHRCWI